MTQIAPYIGRFAPSPTGHLHFGSLVAAVASYLQAKVNHGQWLIRIEDIDPPREIPGSAASILNDLKRLGMRSGQPVLYQSTRHSAFIAARQSLLNSGQAYFCSCSRKSLPASGIYPGTCRHQAVSGAGKQSVRIRTADKKIEFSDGVQGPVGENLAASYGDFVIWRADNLPAYQLAVVVDDAHQAVTEVVRGADLLDSTARQIHLQRALGLTTPSYIHLPVAISAGEKLSKRTGADPLSGLNPPGAIYAALDFLGHRPPQEVSLAKLWSWAIDHWTAERIPARKAISVDGLNGT